MNRPNVDRILDILKNNGIDPIYFFTVLIVLFALSEWKDIRNWKTLKGYKKFGVGAAIYCAICAIFVSLLKLIGVGKF